MTNLAEMLEELGKAQAGAEEQIVRCSVPAALREFKNEEEALQALQQWFNLKRGDRVILHPADRETQTAIFVEFKSDMPEVGIGLVYEDGDFTKVSFPMRGTEIPTGLLPEESK